MNRTLCALASLLLASCTLAVQDLNNLGNSADACDPRGTPHLGEDLDIQFFNTTAHINQDMRFAIVVGGNNSVEAMFVVSPFDDPNMNVFVPEVMPAVPATLAFWADSNANGIFEPLNADRECTPLTMQGMAMCNANAHCVWNATANQCDALPASHQWLRPVCPNGHMTFTHTTPFQDISMIQASGAVLAFHIPMSIQRHELFDNYAIAMWAVRTNMQGRQTRAYYQWGPRVAIGAMQPMQRTPPTVFQVGRNVAGEPRGPIDQGEEYEIHFVIDSNKNGQFELNVDYACVWPGQMAPDGTVFTWDVMPDLSVCNAHGSFDPTTVTH